MARRKARNLDQPPTNVHVTQQWSDDSVIALYSTPSRDPNRRFGAVGTISDSEYATDSESFNSLDETKKQTKFLEELLNYTDSISLDSEGNELRSHGDSSSSYSDWARADRTPSIYGDSKRNNSRKTGGCGTGCNGISSNAKSNNANAGKSFGGMIGLLTCCTYPTNQTVGEPQQDQMVTSASPTANPSQPVSLPTKQSALIAQTENGDFLDHIFNGFENVVCRDSEEEEAALIIAGSGTAPNDPIVIDSRDDRILPPTQSSTRTLKSSAVQLRKTDNDILDKVFEGFEGLVCQNHLAAVEASLRSAPRTADYSHSNPIRTREQNTSNIDTITKVQPGKDMLDSVFEGVEYAMCRDGPPPVNFTNNVNRDNYYAAPARKGFVQSRRGEWRPRQQLNGSYSFERDNSIVHAHGNYSGSQNTSELVQNDSFTFSRKLNGASAATSLGVTGRRDMLDFVFDGVESMVCKDDEVIGGKYNIRNIQSQYDEELPNKQFHWDDE